jgi:hypothetical protein
MAGTHFYSGGLLERAYKSVERTRESAVNNLSDDALVAIILAASAAECFINDMAGLVTSLANVSPHPDDPGFERVIKIGEALESLEKENVGILPKYRVAALLLDSKAIDDGKEPMQSFVQVSSLRNGIVHARPVSTEEKSKYATIVANLAQRGLCKKIDEAKKNTMDAETWWVVMRTPELAHWAVRTANELMLQLVTSMAAIGDYQGLIAGFREQLRSLLVLRARTW